MRKRKPYDHARWAGSQEDVWKHAILCAVLERAARAVRAEQVPFRYVESHAGAGWYAVRGQARYLRGAGRILRHAEPEMPWLELVHSAARQGPRYPGSWRLAAERLAELGVPARMTLCEARAGTAAAAKENAGAVLAAAPGEAHAALTIDVLEADGFPVAAAAIAQGGADLVLVDPIYIDRDWEQVEGLLAAAGAADTAVPCLVWYPVLGDTRADALVAAAGGCGLELITGRGRMGRRPIPKGAGVWMNAAAEALAAPAWPALERLAAALAGEPRLRRRGGIDPLGADCGEAQFGPTTVPTLVT